MKKLFNNAGVCTDEKGREAGGVVRGVIEVQKYRVQIREVDVVINLHHTLPPLVDGWRNFYKMKAG